MSKVFYQGILKILERQPVLAAFVAIVFTFVVGGGSGTLLLQLVPKMQNSGAIYAATFLGSLVIFLLVVWINVPRSVSGVRPIPVGDPRISALVEALDQLRSIVMAKWVKTDLKFEVTMNPDGRNLSQAILGFRASFRVYNLSDSEIPFQFFTEVEGTPETPTSLNGHLQITRVVGNSLVVDTRIRLTQVAGGHVRRHRHQPTMLAPYSEYLFEWTIDEYAVTLPYSEFWASAHSVINIEVKVVNPSGDLSSETVIYRPPDQGDNADPVQSGTTTVWAANGVFLPYQGVFLRVFRKNM